MRTTPERRSAADRLDEACKLAHNLKEILVSLEREAAPGALKDFVVEARSHAACAAEDAYYALKLAQEARAASGDAASEQAARRREET